MNLLKTIIACTSVITVGLNVANAEILYENGPLVNSVGTGVGGLDESVLQFISLGMTSITFSNQAVFENRLADDFTITGNDWDIDTVTLYFSQTGVTASTISAVNLQIWNGEPGSLNSQVIFGDMTTNRMSSTFNSNILRVTDQTTGSNNDRQIAAAIVDIGITLSAGTYWLDWSAEVISGSGPYAIPITLSGQLTTGNARQTGDNGTVWYDANDFGTDTQQGFPFIIEGPSDLIFASGFE